MALKEQATELMGKFLRKCVDNNGMFLFVTAAVGWVLASASQTVGLMANKEISKEEKKFLIPQEILDATFNIATYAAVTLPAMKGVEKLASAHYGGNKQIIEGAKTLAAIGGGVISSNIITPILRNKSGAIIKKRGEQKEIAPTPNTPQLSPNFTQQPRLTMSTYMNLTRPRYSSSTTI